MLLGWLSRRADAATLAGIMASVAASARRGQETRKLPACLGARNHVIEKVVGPNPANIRSLHELTKFSRPNLKGVSHAARLRASTPGDARAAGDAARPEAVQAVHSHDFSVR